MEERANLSRPASVASPSPTSLAERLRFSFCLLLTSCALVSALDLSPLPIALSARGSSACEPTPTQCASVWCNYSRLSTCQEPKEPHQHAEAHSPDSFSPSSTSTQSRLVPLDLPSIPPRYLTAAS